MLTLALESSAKAASAALTLDGELIAQYYQNSGLTHSRTLMAMAMDMLRNTDKSISDVGLIAVARGPGSFTGVRIGVAAAKGLAWAGDIPLAGVSTLDAMSWHGLAASEGDIICAVMDARRSEVYNALYEIKNGAPARLTADRAISLATLAEECGQLGRRAYLIGDGARLAHEYFKNAGIDAVTAPGPMLMQSAWGVAMAAAEVEPHGADELLPEYLRPSQAERERQEKIDKEMG